MRYTSQKKKHHSLVISKFVLQFQQANIEVSKYHSAVIKCISMLIISDMRVL